MKNKFVAGAAVMIYPKSFCSNPDTISSNSFQSSDTRAEKAAILAKAQTEFSNFQAKLSATGFKVLSFDENTKNFTPDALFPNNWFCHLPDGRVFLFPMFPENRRLEYRPDIIEHLKPREVIDMRGLASENIFLEGTGSLILDHHYKMGFACLSARTSSAALAQFSQRSGYEIISFGATDKNGNEIYHTNVMMTMSPQHAVICMDAVQSAAKKEIIEAAVLKMGKSLVSISYDEMSSFAGNMLFIQGTHSCFWACSTAAYEGLSESNRDRLTSEAPFIHSDLRTIETFGGGGARCLLAEAFIS